MDDNRRQFSENEKMILFNEVDGVCPLCGKKLHYTKNGSIYKKFEIAHIYPVNARPDEEALLINEERLGNDINSLENVIAVCRDCHKKFDNPRNVAEYREWVELKRKLLEDAAVRNTYDICSIEEEIREVLKRLVNITPDKELPPLSYQSLTIEQKANDTLTPLKKRSIRNDVVDYFNFIKEVFHYLDIQSPYKFDTIAAQVKSTYFKTMQINDNQEFVFKALVEWLDKKTNSYSTRACEIVIAFFVQNCEVFS